MTLTRIGKGCNAMCNFGVSTFFSCIFHLTCLIVGPQAEGSDRVTYDCFLLMVIYRRPWRMYSMEVLMNSFLGFKSKPKKAESCSRTGGEN